MNAMTLSPGITRDLASLLATGILRLNASPALNSPESAATCLELSSPALLSVSSPPVNGAETPHAERSGQ